MKILITGSTGFVGRTLIPFLVRNGITELCLLIRNEEKAQSLFYGLPVLYINTTSDDWNQQVTAYNPDIVLHMATFFTGHRNIKAINQIVNSNILFPTLLLEALSHTDCKYFINIGTFTEFLYGNEQYFANNLYSASKTAIRSIIQYYQKQSLWKWINIVIYSPYGRKNEQKKVIDFMADALGATVPIKFSLGKQILDFIHVDDIADFFYTVFLHIESFKDSYTQLHLGTGIGHTLRTVGHIMEDISGKKLNADWGGYPYKPFDTMYAVAPIARNLELLNWNSKLSIEEGISIFLKDIGICE